MFNLQIQRSWQRIKKMLEAGRSKPWPIILKEATGDRDLKADAILEYFEPLHDWLKEQRTLKKYPLGWKEHMSTQVLQKKTKRYEAGQGRSGILKTNSGDVSLSFNIPSLSLNDLIKKNANPKEESSESHNNTSPDTQSSGQNKTSEPFDMGKLLASGNSLSIKTSETTATNKDGNTESNNKQFDINSDRTKALDKNSSSQSERSNGYNNQSELTPVGALSLLQKAIAEKLTINKKNETRENLSLASTDLPFTSSGKDVPTETASPNNHRKNESSTISSVPLAVQQRPHSEFPSTAVTLKEPKENPKTAGISPEGKNPLVAAITNDPKPNPLPAGDQIALVPVSLPANLISALNKAFNGSNNSTGLDLSAFKALTNNSKQENQAANTTSLEPENNFDNLNVSPHNSATVQVEETKSENNASVEGTETSKNNTQLDILTGRFSNKSSPAADSQPEDGNYFSSQTVIPCKRSDGLPCLQGKVITEGVSLPSLKTGVDETKQAVSVSPSLLLQKIIEHNAAAKSTPDPVVNAVPNTNNGTVETNEQRSVPTENCNKQIIKSLTGANETSQENKSGLLKSPSEIDISKIISVLTGGKSQLNKLNETKNSTVDDENMSGLTKLAIQENKEVEGYDSKQTSPMKTNKECSDVAKRGVTLTINCGDKKRHRGGSLSISPTELVQRLLESKDKNEVNRKTIPSAHVVKTPNGFQLSFDLNTKDKIPTESKVDNPVGRQQHVDVFNTPKGMVVKPKSSFQLLKPSFVPVQNKDNLELGDKA